MPVAGRVLPTVFALQVLLAHGSAAPLPSDDAVQLSPGPVRWVRLEYRAKKLFFTGEAALEWESIAPASGPPSAVAPSPAREGETIRIVLDSSFGRESSELTLSFDPRTGAAIRRTQLQRAEGLKIYDFGPSGAHYRKLEPGPGQEGLDPEQWRQTYERFYENASGLASPAVEPTALLYLLSYAPLNGIGDRWPVLLFSKRQFLPVELELTGTRKIKVDYMAVTSAGKSRQHEHRQVDVVRLRPVGQAAANDIRLLGLKGEIELYLDAATRLPLELRGRVGWLSVRVVLREAVLE